MKFDTLIQNFKDLFSLKPRKLIVQYDTCDIAINLRKQIKDGITSQTFNKLMSSEFSVDNNRDESGLKITTLIDKKTGAPVRAYVAGITADIPDTENYCIMVEDATGEMSVNNKRYKIIGSTYFCINKNKKMVTPKFDITVIKGQLYEKVCAYMKSTGNSNYTGIGIRLHQIRVERMLQENLGNVQIVAEGNSFPFHYSMGYRLVPTTRPIEDCIPIAQEFSRWNKKVPQENLKYLHAKQQDGKYVIDWSATLEDFLCDYYRCGGAPLDEFLPNMFLNKSSVKQWIAMIQKQPILY